MKDESGSAFPWHFTLTANAPMVSPLSGTQLSTGEIEHNIHGGISVRDYFAAKAMATMYTDADTGSDWRSDEADDTFAAYVAKTAYEMADAMLKARQS